MMTEEQDFNAITIQGTSLAALLQRLQEGGPPVDEAVLLAYVADSLDKPSRETVAARIVTWRAWHTAYWELLADIGEMEALLGNDDASTTTQAEADEQSTEQQIRSLADGEGPAERGRDSRRSREAPYSLALGSGPEGPEYQKRFDLSANTCEWTPVAPAEAIGSTGWVEARWVDGMVLKVTVGGFLKISPRHQLKVVWQSADGSPRAEGTARNPFVPVVELSPQDGSPPRPGDELRLINTFDTGDASGWSVTAHLALA